MIRVLVADPHRSVAESFCAALARERDITPVAAACTVLDAVRASSRIDPDVVLAATQFPDGSAFELVARARRRSSARFVLLAGHGATAFEQRAKQLGLWHTVRSASVLEIADFVRRAAAGERPVVHPAHPLKGPTGSGGLSALSPRLVDVLRLIALGHSIRQIADELGITEKGVESAKYRIGNALGIRNRVHLARFAIRHGLVGL